MMLRSTIIGLLFAVFATLTSCAPEMVKTYANEYRTRNFNAYATFRIAPPVANPVYFTSVYEQEINNAITRTLRKRGYQPADTDTDADFVVQYIACIRDDKQANDFETIRNWWRLHKTRSVKNNANNLYISISITDDLSGNLLWQGQTTGLTNGALSQNQPVLAETTDRIMDQFYFSPKKPLFWRSTPGVVSASSRKE